MEPGGLGGVPLIGAHQHGGGLLPGGGLGGLEEELAALGDAADDAHGVGQGDVPPVFGHIVKGKRGAFLCGGQGLIAQGADQHHRHVLAADGVLGVEVQARVDGAVHQGRLHGRVKPVAALHVGEGGGLGLGLLPAEHPPEDGDEFAPGHIFIKAEAAVAAALHEAVFSGLFNGLNGPVALRHVGVAALGRCGGRGDRQQQADGQGGGEDTSFHRDLRFSIYKMKWFSNCETGKASSRPKWAAPAA